MRNKFPIVIIFLAFISFSMAGCQKQGLPHTTLDEDPVMVQVPNNQDNSTESSTDEQITTPFPAKDALTGPSDEGSSEEQKEGTSTELPTSPADLDYYFMSSRYGLGDYPDFDTFFAEPDALSRLKQFYSELNQTVARVEYHLQSLMYDGTYTGDPGFSASGSVNAQGDDGQFHTMLKTLMIGKAEYDSFDDYVETGRNFEADDFTIHALTDSIPVILGHAYAGLYEIGDTLPLSLHLQPLTFTVVGFLQANTTFRFDLDIPLDRYILVPLYDIAYEPADAANEYYQEHYYMQKCDGFVGIDPAANAEEMFRTVEELAEEYDLHFAVTPKKRKMSNSLSGEKTFL